MKAMILAAGLGKRMLPLTLNTPKPLIKVKEQALIVHIIKALAKIGVKDIVINVHHHAQQMKNYLLDGEKYGVNLFYSEEDKLLDTGGGINKALPLLGDEPFLVVSADIFSDFPFSKLLKGPKGLAHLVMVDNPEYNQTGDFNLEDGSLTLAEEDKLTYGNIGIFRAELFSDSPEGAFPLSMLLKRAIKEGKISGEYYKGIWHNIGTPEILDDLNEEGRL